MGRLCHGTSAAAVVAAVAAAVAAVQVNQATAESLAFTWLCCWFSD